MLTKCSQNVRHLVLFTDDRYFKLRLLALHDAGITPFL